MRLHHITLLQDPEKQDLVSFFYSEILGLPAETESGPNGLRWFEEPVYLVARPATEADGEAAWGGFSGIQLNVVPAKDLNPIVATLRATGTKQPAPRDVGEHRLMTVHDPSKNHIMLVGSDEVPTEPCFEEGIGSVSIFVTDIDKARAFYVEALHLPVRAEPHEGMIVIGEEDGTALMLYQASKDNPNTPIGRHTGLAFTDDNVNQVLDDVLKAGGSLVHKSDLPGIDHGVIAATLADPDNNQFIVLSTRHLSGGSGMFDPMFD